MSDAYFTLAAIATTAVTCAWMVAGMAISLARTFGRTAPDIALRVHHELRPFYLAAAVVKFVAGTALHPGFEPWRVIGLATALACWYFYKDIGGDDDRWKRRRRKLAESVRVSGGRLAVVPAGGAS